MKILFGMPSKDSWGGPISSEPPFVEAMRKLSADEVTEEIYVYGDKDKPTPLFNRVRRVWKTAFRFRRILKKQDFDIIHLNTAFDLKTILRDSFSLFVMHPERAKIFFKLHGSEADKFENANFFVRFLISYLKERVDGFGVHTREELENFARLGFDKNKFYFVKNAVTIHEQLPENFARETKDQTDVFKLLFVSRFIPAKGLIETIRACKILKGRGFNFTLTCVGNGEMRDEAEKKAAEFGLQSQVKFTGYIPEEDVTKHFFECDIFVFPTRHAEGFPNVLFKAASVGMPVVTTEIRAAKDYLKKQENCLFCTQEPENIAEKIIELIENKTLREKMSRKNLELGKTLLPENIAADFLEIYAEILSKN